jgi:6-pyruvoyltetrahydropterin/6-carboxytetrahydropterin synthase
MKIDSAHRIEDYVGKCKNLHGHTWEIVIFKSYQHWDNKNIAEDFHNIPKKEVKEIYEKLNEMLDHKYLNEVFDEKNLTSEFLSKKIYEFIKNNNLLYYPFIVMVREGSGGICLYDGEKWWLGK